MMNDDYKKGYIDGILEAVRILDEEAERLRLQTNEGFDMNRNLRLEMLSDNLQDAAVHLKKLVQ